MAAATLIAPRYSAEDFETRSMHSVAPSYISEVPSYHSTAPAHHEPIPPYTPRTNTSTTTSSRQQEQQQTYGLPPIPPIPTPSNIPSIHNFRIPTWSTSTHNNPTVRQYRSVIERRAAATPSARHNRWASLESSAASSSAAAARDAAAAAAAEASDSGSDSGVRPLEDPHLVGEQAAAEARRERLGRENGDDILIREDKHWDWLLAQMETWDQRERSWQKYQRDVVERSQRRGLLRSVRGRLRG